MVLVVKEEHHWQVATHVRQPTTNSLKKEIQVVCRLTGSASSLPWCTVEYFQEYSTLNPLPEYNRHSGRHHDTGIQPTAVSVRATKVLAKTLAKYGVLPCTASIAKNVRATLFTEEVSRKSYKQ